MMGLSSWYGYILIIHFFELTGVQMKKPLKHTTRVVLYTYLS